MTIRWRLAVVLAQLSVLSVATSVVEGRFYSASTWFFAGLLAMVLNSQLLEPHFPTPVDTLTNSAIATFLYLTADKENTEIGWHAAAVVLGVILVASLIALVFGAGREAGTLVRLARSARVITQAASARFIYSLIFFLSILSTYSVTSDSFWTLAIAWMVVVILGSVNWQGVWSTAAGRPVQTHVDGMVGPSRLLVSGPSLPESGAFVRVSAGGHEGTGVIITRILRLKDMWGEIHMSDPAAAEHLLARGSASVSSYEPEAGERVVGSVDTGSTHEHLVFTTAKDLTIGSPVAVLPLDDSQPTLYQVSSAEVTESAVKGGSHLTIRTTADQIGGFDQASLRLAQYRWVPRPGGPVVEFADTGPDQFALPDDWMQLGTVLGTHLPVFLDLSELVSGHLAILGMTKMGKTTLSVRIAQALANRRRVVALDQTGEYSGKRGLPVYDKTAAWDEPNLSVLNLPKDEVGAEFALAFVEKIAGLAADEYEKGEPHPRSIMFDEAHQFVPEPAGLGFGAPGRDSSYALGTHFMQLRKYGISLILVSQRTAVVAKSALSQCENLIVFRSVDRTGLEYLEQIAGPRAARIVPSLAQGEALVVGPAISSDYPVVVSVEHSD